MLHRNRILLHCKPALRLAVVLGTFIGARPAQAAPADDQAFDQLAGGYLAEFPTSDPVEATDLGLHDHDGEITDYRPAAVAKEVQRLRGWLVRLEGLPPNHLSPARAIDHELLHGTLEAKLLSLENVQRWRHSPHFYSSLASEAIYVLIKRDFAPAPDRLRSAIAREEKIPDLLAVARANLVDVPRIYVETTLLELPAIISFFEKDVPLAFAGVKDAALSKRFENTNREVVRSLAAYRLHLEKTVLPKSRTGFALGEALLRAKLHAEDRIDVPLEELLRLGKAELGRLQKEFQATAARIDKTRSWAEVQATLGRDHGAPGEVIGETAARLDTLRGFVVSHGLVTIPGAVKPEVHETPPFLRATTFASMDTPGPFETHSTEARYNVTLPDPSWPPADVESFMAGFSRPLIDVVSIHEAFPGHYVQFLWSRRWPSKLRMVHGARSNVEGWAHYCEQMMLDEGYGAGDAKLRLAQLQDALLRAARFVAAIRMHARKMTFAEAVELFQREGYQTKKVAEMEARRGTEDATYLVYTLGKLEIQRLREDYRRKWGAAYTPAKFHDAFLAQGPLPLPLMRRALLGE